MKPANCWRSIIALLLTLNSGVLCLAEESFLLLSSNVPEVDVENRIDDGLAIDMPELRYIFQVALQCGKDRYPQSLLLSIADTRKRLSGDDLRADTEVVLSVPSDQIAPVVARTFCTVGESDEIKKRDQVTMHGTLSAQAALLCEGDKNPQMIHASLALDLTLNCNVDEPPNDN